METAEFAFVDRPHHRGIVAVGFDFCVTVVPSLFDCRALRGHCWEMEDVVPGLKLLTIIADLAAARPVSSWSPFSNATTTLHTDCALIERCPSNAPAGQLIIRWPVAGGGNARAWRAV